MDAQVIEKNRQFLISFIRHHIDWWEHTEKDLQELETFSLYKLLCIYIAIRCKIGKQKINYNG